MSTTNIKMNKPIAIGLAILDLSKEVMYGFHYDYIKPKYSNNVRLAYTDTDSFIYQFKTDDIYSDMKENIHRFDTSDYEHGNRNGIPQKNKKIPGLFKDELKGEIVTAFAGLRSKMYCVQTGEIDKMKKKLTVLQM